MGHFGVLWFFLLLQRGTGDLCDICRRNRDNAIRMPYNQRWFFDLSVYLCQPFNFCDDEITEQLKGQKSKQEIRCDGMDCFEWLYKSLQRREAEESNLPKVLLKHRTHKEAITKVSVTTAPPMTSTVKATMPSHIEAASTETELLGMLDMAFDDSLLPNKPEVVHVVLEKNTSHNKPPFCALNPDRGRRWPCSQRWYYNAVFDDCRTFTFCGQKGNKNNFVSNATCYEQCHDPQ
ncbi:uncharacterized protein LOC135394514 [Ornithodoros turicata]|uniref:uncharacterized protein LOC135394514 n=1 Tax=Ornithodoros turicata TaxID=34597 RepID=UPI003139E33A